MSYKAFCDSCGKEIDFKTSNHHKLWYQHGKMGRISVVINVMEGKPDGEPCQHFQTCARCIREIGGTLLKIIPESENGEKT